jgi:antitoxin VapB
MSLNIKNEETCRLVEELAQLKGVSLTAAVTSAVKEDLARQRTFAQRQQDPERLERMRAIALDAASRFKEPWKSIDHGEYLYDDELGLPK